MTRLNNSLRNFDNAAIFTIHGFCNRILNEFSFETGSSFDVELVTDQSSYLQRSAVDFWRREINTSSRLFINYLGSRNYNVKNLISLLIQIDRFPAVNVVPSFINDSYIRYEDAFRETFDKTRKEWQKNRAEIETVIFGHEALNRSIYKKIYIPTWLDKLNQYLDGDGSEILFEKFENFTQAKISRSIKKGKAAPDLVFFEYCDELHDLYYKLTRQRLTALEYRFSQTSIAGLNELKRADNVLYYSDLLQKVRTALSVDRGDYLANRIRKRYRAALIDEFQDTDPIQYDIFSRLFSDPAAAMFLIGDPKQAIYSFRGADIFTYLKASGQVENRWTLTRNWRSSAGMVKAFNTLLEDHNRPFLFENIKYLKATSANKSDPPAIARLDNDYPELCLWYLDRNSAGPYGLVNRSGNLRAPYCRRLIARSVSSKIRDLLSPRPTSGNHSIKSAANADDIAVLVNTNKEARLIRDTLAEYNIPAVLFSDSELFETQEAIELLRILKAINAPNSGPLVRSALATDLVGMTVTELYNLRTDDFAWEKCLHKFDDYNRTWQRYGFMRLSGRLLIRENIRQRCLLLKNGRRRLTNLLHLFDVLNGRISDANLNPDAAIAWLENQIYASSGIEARHELRLEIDEKAVQIMTIHKSKGLEFPIVFNPFTWRSKTIKPGQNMVYHDPTNDYEPVYNLNLDESENGKISLNVELLAESMRLFYVALTRAKSKCYLVWGKFNEAQYSAMTYLLLNPPLERVEDAITYLQDTYKALDETDLIAGIQKIRNRNPVNIQISELPPADDKVLPRKKTLVKNLSCPEFD